MNSSIGVEQEVIKLDQWGGDIKEDSWEGLFKPKSDYFKVNQE